MTKHEILNYFRGINNAYNDCTRFDSLSHMIDELLEKQQETIASLQGTICKLNAALGKQPEIVRCKDCKYDPSTGYPKEELPYWYPCKNGMRDQDWFCGYGERR